MAKTNPILAAYEAQLEAKHRKKLDITMQLGREIWRIKRG